MEAAMICHHMGWTFQEYEAQPASFVLSISQMLKADAEKRQKAIDDNKLM